MRYMDRYLQFLKVLGFYPLTNQWTRDFYWLRCWNWLDGHNYVIQSGLLFYTLIGPQWFKPFAYRSCSVATPKQGLNVVAFHNIALFLPPCFSLHLGTKKHHLLQMKKAEKVPNHHTGRTIPVFSLLRGADLAWSLRAATISQNSRDPCSFRPSLGSKCAWEESITSDQMKPQLSAMGGSTKLYLQLFSFWLCPSTAAFWDSTSQRLSFHINMFFPTRRDATLCVVFMFWAVTGQPLWAVTNLVSLKCWVVFIPFCIVQNDQDLQEWREEIVLDIHQRQISVFQLRGKRHLADHDRFQYTLPCSPAITVNYHSWKWFIPVTDGLFRRFSLNGCAEVLENRSGEYSRLQVWWAGAFFDDSCWVASDGYSDIYIVYIVTCVFKKSQVGLQDQNGRWMAKASDLDKMQWRILVESRRWYVNHAHTSRVNNVFDLKTLRADRTWKNWQILTWGIWPSRYFDI